MKYLANLLLVSLFVFQLTGCGSKITEENYTKIKNGMTEDEVIAILGKPSDRSSSGIGTLTTTGMTWQDENITITVQLINGKVQLKNYSH